MFEKLADISMNHIKIKKCFVRNESYSQVKHPLLGHKYS